MCERITHCRTRSADLCCFQCYQIRQCGDIVRVKLNILFLLYRVVIPVLIIQRFLKNRSENTSKFIVEKTGMFCGSRCTCHHSIATDRRIRGYIVLAIRLADLSLATQPSITHCRHGLVARNLADRASRRRQMIDAVATI